MKSIKCALTLAASRCGQIKLEPRFRKLTAMQPELGDDTMTAYVEPDVFFTEVGQADALRRIAVRSRRWRRPRGVLAVRLQFRHARHKGAGARCVGRRTRPRLCAIRLFRAWGIRRRVRGRHHQPLAGGELAVFERLCRGPQIVVGSSMGGWLALLLAREIARRPRTGLALAGLVLIAPAADFTEELMWKGFPAEAREEIASKGAVAAPVAIWRALSDHARVDRGRPQASPARRLDQCRLPGAHPAGRAGPGRALATRLCADIAAAERRRGADPDPGRRPSPVAAQDIARLIAAVEEL